MTPAVMVLEKQRGWGVSNLTRRTPAQTTAVVPRHHCFGATFYWWNDVHLNVCYCVDCDELLVGLVWSAVSDWKNCARSVRSAALFELEHGSWHCDQDF